MQYPKNFISSISIGHLKDLDFLENFLKAFISPISKELSGKKTLGDRYRILIIDFVF